jgi:hypothetical protein
MADLTGNLNIDPKYPESAIKTTRFISPITETLPFGEENPSSREMELYNIDHCL